MTVTESCISESSVLRHLNIEPVDVISRGSSSVLASRLRWRSRPFHERTNARGAMPPLGRGR
jgi:hypothetical protein